MAIPYAPSRLYQPDSSIIDIILQSGREKAQLQRASGQNWGNAVSGLGQIASNTIRDIADGKAQMAEQKRKAEIEAPRIAQEAEIRQMTIDKGRREAQDSEQEAIRAEKLGALFSGEAPPTPNAIISLMGPQRGLEIVKGLSAIQPDSEKQIARYRDQATLFRDAIGGLTATPEPLKPQAWQMARSALLSKGLITEDMVPAEWSPEAEAVAVNFGRAPEKHEGFTLNPGDVRFDASGKKLASVAPRPEKPDSPSYQAKDILDDSGKPVTANYNSRSGQYTGPDGQVIKNPRPIPSDRVSQDQQKFKKAAPVIAGISDLSEKINTGAGLLAKMSGGAAKLAAKANYDDDVAEYESLVSGFTPMVARALGHTGVLTQQDVDSVKNLFPRPGDSKTLRDRKVNQIKNIISELEGVGAGGADLAVNPATTPAAANPLTVVIQGKTVTFQSKAQLDAWKKAAGVK